MCLISEVVNSKRFKKWSMVFYLIPYLNLRIQNRKRKTEIYLGIGVFEKRLINQVVSNNH